MRAFERWLWAGFLLIAALSAGCKKSSVDPSKPADKAASKEEPPVVTHHEIHVGGRVLRYTATTGYMPIRSEDSGEVEANIFFMAYTLDGAPVKRPLMFLGFPTGDQLFPSQAANWLTKTRLRVVNSPPMYMVFPMVATRNIAKLPPPVIFVYPTPHDTPSQVAKFVAGEPPAVSK